MVLGYILRRLSIMVPTLLGISLVTLALIHLAPGDPVELQVGGAIEASTLSAEDIEALRKAYFLDLPVLFNPAPRDVKTTVAEVLASLRSDDEAARNRARGQLSRLGAVAFRDAIPALSEADGPARKAILAALRPVALRMGLQEDLEAAMSSGGANREGALGFWRSLLERIPERPETDAGIAVARLVRDPSDANLDALRPYDTWAIAPLIDALLSVDPDERAAVAITSALNRLTGVGNTIRAGDNPLRRARTVDDWRRWWRVHERDFVAWRGIRRYTAMVTETQYGKWLDRLVHLDFDRSSRDHLPIREKLGRRLRVTLTLALSSLFIAYLIAMPLGIFSAMKQYSLADRATTVGLFMLYSLPTFWVAMLLQQYLCGVDPAGVDWFPLVGLGVEALSPEGLSAPGALGSLLWHLVLPVFVLTYRSFAYLSRYQRGAMLEIIRQDFIRTARAKGLPERLVIMRHAVRNSILPVITLLGMQLPFLVGGAVIVESIFQINGMGLETLDAIRTRDINWIMAAVTVTSLVTMGGILLSDVLYAVVDPRVRDALTRERTR